MELSKSSQQSCRQKIKRTTTCLLSPQDIINRFGADALHPTYLTTYSTLGVEEVVLVPKMRVQMGEEAWSRMDLYMKEGIVKLFYEWL